MARLDDLQKVRDDLVARMDVCPSDQNFSVMGRLFVDVVKQIADLTGEVSAGGTALDELAARRRAAGRPNASGFVDAEVSYQ